MPTTPPTRLASSLFTATYASRAAVGASAPGRVNLIGEHTDYNGGPVLPFALPRKTVVLAAAAPQWEAVSNRNGAPTSFLPDDAPVGTWTDYLSGVVRVLREMRAAPDGASIAVASSVPEGAGLSSSAALTVAAARALSRLARRQLSKEAIAEVAYRAESEIVGVRCGRMDQTIAVEARSGQALLFETGAGTARQVPFPIRVLMVETGVTHHLAAGDYNLRRAECEEALDAAREAGIAVESLAEVPIHALSTMADALPAVHFHRLRHVVTETARTREAAAALDAGDYPRLGKLLFEGHASLRDDFESSCAEADLLVGSALTHGAWGARLTGAGWGGAVLVIAPPDRFARLRAGLVRDFRRSFGRAPEHWETRAAGGLKPEPVP
jgi:galactokinase